MGNLEDIIYRPKIIYTENGNILRVLKNSDKGYHGFGEAYFSEIKNGEIKGWKKHSKMICNIVCPVGEVLFVLYYDGMFTEIRISKDEHNYKRLVIPAGVWFGFKGIDKDTSMILNIASIKHDPEESINCDLNEIPYNWGI